MPFVTRQSLLERPIDMQAPTAKDDNRGWQGSLCNEPIHCPKRLLFSCVARFRVTFFSVVDVEAKALELHNVFSCSVQLLANGGGQEIGVVPVSVDISE